MVDAISEYVEREEKREAFRQDGIRAWNEYQTTGLHVTFEEAAHGLLNLKQGKMRSRLHATSDLGMDDIKRAGSLRGSLYYSRMAQQLIIITTLVPVPTNFQFQSFRRTH